MAQFLVARERSQGDDVTEKEVIEQNRTAQ